MDQDPSLTIKDLRDQMNQISEVGKVLWLAETDIGDSRVAKATYKMFNLILVSPICRVLTFGLANEY